MFDALANDARLHLFMEFKPGDVQARAHHTILHDRTSFVDWARAGTAGATCCVCGWRRPMRDRIA